MIFRQILHPETGCASYLFGCTGKQKLAAVDPHAAHIEDYLAVAEAAASPIVAIFETHLHADHPSGATALARRTGAPIYLYQGTEVEFPYTPVRDGDEVPLGNDYVRILHTPGHSPHSMSLLVGDRVRADAHWFALTGDTLFVGDAGRPDLTAGDTAADPAGAASALYDSLQNLLTLPDDLEIYPAHFAGSACGRTMSGKPVSTIGFERRFNLALQPRSREDFVAFMLADLPLAPEDSKRILEANRRGLPAAALLG